MTERDYRDYLNDIASYTDDAISFIEDLTYKEFIADRKSLYAVVRCLEVIGEATSQVPKKIRDKSPDMPWVEMKGLRNRIAHEYFGINNKIVWNTVKHDLPTLKPLISELLKQAMK